MRVSVVTDDVPDADIVRAVVFGSIVQYGLQRLKVGVDVTEYRKLHSPVAGTSPQRNSRTLPLVAVEVRDKLKLWSAVATGGR